MEIFRLPKPEHIVVSNKILDKANSSGSLFDFIQEANQPQYLYWDKIRYKPLPEELTAEEFWAIIKLLRKLNPNRVDSAVTDQDGNPFTWQPLPGMDYFLHEVDMTLGGKLESVYIDDQRTRRRYITRGIMEEAIASSQLEGANTTRKAAKRMILESKRPTNRSEQMICNNYEAMLQIESEFRNRPLSEGFLLWLHAVLTKDTIDDTDIGRFRKDSDDIVVSDLTKNVVYHTPPPEIILRKEIKRLIAYANGELKREQFVHPLIKAIILHFWIGYLHPFTDGNGRLARTIFYWYLLRHEYWAFSYLPLSRVIRNSAAQYRDAYVYAEQDDNDLTYFIDYNIRKIAQAKSAFESYLKRKENENRQMTEGARLKYNLNDRQIYLLRYFHKNPELTTTIKTHAHINDIGRLTARKDLEQLEELGFLMSKKVGRERPFRATQKTSDLLT